jgi:acetyl-CoA synthetase
MPENPAFDLVNPIVRRWQRDAAEDPEAFWARAAEALPWFRRWDRVFEWYAASERPDMPRTVPDVAPGFSPGRSSAFRWYIGGETNLAYNCVDHHVKNGRGGQAALVALDERGGRSVYTYAQLLTEVKRAAAALRALGIGEGDRVAIYMPTCAEAIILMLACLRIGAVHLVVFAGFGANALSERAKLAGAKALFASDITYRRGRDVSLMEVVKDAVDATRRGADSPSPPAGRGLGGGVEHVVILQRDENIDLSSGYLPWDAFLEQGAGHDYGHVALESDSPAYILATSGTTATPKLAVHTHGAYQVYIHAMARWQFGLRPDDVWWATSDIGWVVGHSYMVYAPLLIGATTLLYEGAIDYPDIETFYRLSAENGVTGVFTSPTAIRVLMRSGAEPARKHDLSSIERVFSAGEVLNPAAWEWFQREVFQDRIPVVDHMWQTETAGPIVGNPYGLGLLPIKPGAAGVPLPGIEAAVIVPENDQAAETTTDSDEAGSSSSRYREAKPGEKGIFVIKRPFPGLTNRLWAEPERYGPVYWERVPGQTLYFSGDAAAIDEDGYVWFSGRADEIIKIAAHRIGTIEVESAILRHAAVAEAGVTGRPDELRGEVIAAFVVLKNGYEPSSQLQDEIRATIRRELGPVAVVGGLDFVDVLPKTRSGKIMRRVLKAVTLDVDPGDISTIEDEGSVDEAREAWAAMKAAMV